MAGQVDASPTFGLTPAPQQVALNSNYITNFDFLNQYLPDTYEKEFERYGNRSVASFLRMVSAELPSESDLIKWTEQGRLHTKYIDCASDGAPAADTATITVSDVGDPAFTAANGIAVRVGQTVLLSGTGGTTDGMNKAIVTAVDLSADTFDVAYYEAGGQVFSADSTVSMFIYGSEFKKGTNGMQGSNEAVPDIFENSPIILKDKYSVNGSDMAQIGWVEVTTENGATGYLWYLKSEHETRLRFDDYLETSMIEAVPAETGSGAIAATGDVGNKGTEGVFHVVANRGNVWSGGNPTTLAEWDTVVSRLDKQGSIEENAIFNDRDFGFDIDDMVASQNANYDGGTSWGLFNNDKEMALNLGFVGFRRGYDFYKTDWKYLNDPTMRGGLTGAAKINGLLVPAGTTTVYDQVLGKNAKRPFLHVRYRASAREDRKYKTWMTGSAGGVNNSDLDAMEVNFLSERAICTLGANNFFLFTD
jgi:hypothetical protein